MPMTRYYKVKKLEIISFLVIELCLIFSLFVGSSFAIMILDDVLETLLFLDDHHILVFYVNFH